MDWYKPRKDKETTFVNSLAKRIVRDLTCESTIARLAAALLEFAPEAQSNSTVAGITAAKPGLSGMSSGQTRSTFKAKPREKQINTTAIGFRFEGHGEQND